MAVVTLGLLAILARLWYLQVARGDDLLAASEGNRSRLIRRVPPRGQILDRKGRVLATNRPRIVVSVVPETVRKHPEMLYLLASLLETTPEDLEAIIQAERISPFDPVRVAIDVDIATATRVEEQRLNLPDVLVGPEPLRYYPDGPLFGHLLGQMGQIAPEELKTRRREGYRPGDSCGKLGLERAYDSELRGTDGGQKIEVDARGRMRGMMENTDPIPGDTLMLTLDRDLQRIAWQELSEWAAKGKPGAVVALDPQTGAVLAMVSVPSYDPNQFVAGVSKDYWEQLRQNPLKPLINRAIGSAYAPGSTFKMITAAAGLETGQTSPGDGAYCPGYLALGRWIKHCHKRGGHGSVSLNSAISQSCDVFFYHLGQRLGPDRLAEFARRFGLGKRTRIRMQRPGDASVERMGIVPDPVWKRASRHGEWVGGDTVDYAIGQAMLACTPLQMCNVAAAIGNGGTLYRPQMVQTVRAYDAQNRPSLVYRLQPEAMQQVGLSPTTLAILIQGMRTVMESGTGAHSNIPGLDIAGKTGTAQMVKDGVMQNNAWFIGFAPATKPRIAICVFVETGGHGGETAAPIARKLFAQFFGVTVDAAEATATTD